MKQTELIYKLGENQEGFGISDATNTSVLRDE